jgi:hypothetical protein
VLGGDHSIGYPTVRGVSQHLDGNLGIIHLDRHVDTQETDLDERMHTTPWFHATDIPNVPAHNLVQIGIGGWQAPRPGVKVGRPQGRAVAIMARKGGVTPVDYETNEQGTHIFSVQENLDAFSAGESMANLTYSAKRIADFQKGAGLTATSPDLAGLFEDRFVRRHAGSQ